MCLFFRLFVLLLLCRSHFFSVHLPCRGQREFLRQLHVFSGDFLRLRVLAFLLEIIFCILCVVLYQYVQTGGVK